MGTLRDHRVICPKCDARFTAGLVSAVNVRRFPEMKEQILNRTFNRARCPLCGTVSAVERRFMYTDTTAGLAVVVHPRKERHLHHHAVAEAQRVVTPLTQGSLLRANSVRVAFGLEELREKVVANAAGYSDQLIELMKLYVIREHPFLTQKRRMRITLDSINAEKATFNCTFDLDEQMFQVYVPIAFFDSLIERLDQPRRLDKRFAAAAKDFNAGPKAAWVNLWSLNPSNDALATLRQYAQDISEGKPVNLDAPAFQKMLKTLPKGAQLASSAKRDLSTVQTYARTVGRGDIEDKLFEVRFAIDLEDDWFRNSDSDDIGRLWTLLKNLPDIAVEGSTWIKSIKYDSIGFGGTYWEKEIVISDQMTSDSAAFRNVVLHEVGHSVHDKFDREKSNFVSRWLTSEYGWRKYPLTNAGIDQWIGAMGGYPAGVAGSTKAQIRSYIQQSTGRAIMNQPVIVDGPAGHLWNDHQFGPRAAFDKTSSSWWASSQGWHAANGQRFFVNHYYQELMSVSEAAIALLPSMPSTYAMMSPFEFFAELFAWVFDEQAANRPAIPAGVSQWFQANIGGLDLAAPAGSVRGAPIGFPLMQKGTAAKWIVAPVARKRLQPPAKPQHSERRRQAKRA